MRRKTCIVIAFAALFISVNVYAAPSARIDRLVYGGNEITVIGEISGGEAGLTLAVVKEGGDLNSDAVALDEGTYNGEFEFVFEMPEDDDVNGSYVVYVNSPDGGDEYEFEYVSVADQREFLETLAASDDIDAVLSDAENRTAAVCAGIDMTNWDMSRQEDVSSYLQNEDVTAGNIVQKLNEAIYFVCYNNEKDGMRAQELLALLGYSWLEEAYADMSDERKETVNQKMMSTSPYDDKSSAEARFNEINGLIDLGQAKTGEIEKMLEEYAGLLGYSSRSEYREYSNLSGKSDENADIVNALYRNNPYTVDGLMSIIESAVKSGSSSGNSSTGTGGNRGSVSNTSDRGSSISSDGGLTGGPVTPDTGSTNNENEDADIPLFSDLDQAEWAREAVEALAEREMISGYGDGRFNPNGTITREEFITMIIRAAGLNLTGVFCDFSDVDHDAWYYPYVASGYTNGIVSGMGDGTMGIGKNVTRQDMAVIIVKTMERMGIERTEVETVSFSDEDNIAGYAKSSVSLLAGIGIVAGKDGAFDPEGNLTRAEAARVMYALFILE